jgi:dTDP-3-amino-3,4,6-trideoxy-alpha-D-glucose transaminase
MIRSGEVSMSDPIPLVAIERQHEALAPELRAAFDRVVGTSAFILGEEVERFEEEFAAYCGVRHCVGVASGTAAITLAVKAAGIGPGDEVIVPAHTFVASALGVMHAGATPTFCDVDDGTGLLDLDSAAHAVTSRTTAILAVHLYGQPCDMGQVNAFAKRHGLVVFEDAAQAHGASLDGKRAGSLGTAAAFSFYPSKNLGALGDAGAVCTDDGELAERVRMLRDLGRRGKQPGGLRGHNERLDGLQAAMLRVKLPHLNAWNAARRAHAVAYRDLLGDSVRMLEERVEGSCVYHLFPVRTSDRDTMRARLNEEEIGASVHYSPAVHEQPAFRDLDLAGRFPAAETWAAEELSLPLFPELRADEIERVAQICGRVTART